MLDYEEIMLNLIRYQGTDPVSGKPITPQNATYHHQLHNKAGNRKRFPLFINSYCNGLAVATESIGADNRFVITDQTAERYEAAFRAIDELFKTEEVEIMKFMWDIGLLWKRAGK